MANIVRDPKEHPDAILPDLSRPNPLVKFTKDDIAFVYGSKWKQRYFKKVGDEYFVFLHGGISQIRFGALTSSKMEPIGGRPSILQTT